MNADQDLFEDTPTSAELAQIDAPEERWPRTLAEFIDVLRATFRRLGLTDAKALELAAQGVLAIGQYNGGKQVYWPTGERLLTAVRDRRIYAEANGNNKFELAARYHLTPRRIEQIVAEQRAIYIDKLQRPLFDQ